MRINKWLASTTHLSRRAADDAIKAGRVRVNGVSPELSYRVLPTDKITLDDDTITKKIENITIALHKPTGYVCSRRGQGSKTIYDLLPDELKHLKPAGRLDKDSSGLLIMSSDGTLLNELTHPSKSHKKHYIVSLDKPLAQEDELKLTAGVDIGDERPSVLGLKLLDSKHMLWEVTLEEGRNRQIRRSFAVLRYEVLSLHRTKFAHYELQDLKLGGYKLI